ncbi:hypothetical protein ACFV2B_07515 [Streptomyces lavendulae]|uniref:hypothetical protein n=1 Tax=Streptomyces lavendulae TaxID=1914 RepID=UPI0036C24E32
MAYLIPDRTPLTPKEVDRAFDYLAALQSGGGAHSTSLTESTPELAFLLLRLAENIVFPVTGLLGDGDPHTDSFALDEVGCILLSALRDWTRDSPTTAALGNARTIIRFVENVIPDPDDHGDTLATLETMRREHLEWAHTVHCMTGRP